MLLKKLARHDCVCIFCGRWFCSSGWDGGCCACSATPGCPSPSKVSCWVARKTHATFSPSLRCVSFVNCVGSLHDVLDFSRRTSRCCSLLVVPLQGNDTFGDSLLECAHFPSPRGPFRVPLRGTGLLLSCSRSTSLDSAFVFERRALLPIIETQKSP